MARSVWLIKLKCFIFYIPTAVITYLFLITVFLPFALYRYFIRKFVHWHDPTLGPMLSGPDALFCGPHPYSKPVNVMLPSIPLKQKVDRVTIVNFIESKLSAINDYPNLKQRIVKKYGYYFWKDVEKFSVADYVTHFNESDPEKPVTTSEFRQWAIKNAEKVTFNPNRSPWQFLLIENYVESDDPQVKSLAILKVNHCLMDGYSLAKFMQLLAKKPWRIHQEHSFTANFNESWIDKLKKFFIFAIALPYESPLFLRRVKDENDIWDKPLRLNDNQSIWHATRENPRPLSLIRLKAVKAHYNVSMASLILTLTSVAIAKHFKKQFGKLPEKMSTPCVIPAPQHPNAMENHVAAIRLFLRAYDEDPVKTLKTINKKYMKDIKSTRPLLMYWNQYLLGVLPVWFYMEKKQIATQTQFLTNFPGPEMNEVDFCGFQYKRINGMVSPLNGSGFLFECVSVGSNLYLDFLANSFVIPSSEAALEFHESIHSVLDILEKSIKSSV